MFNQQEYINDFIKKNYRTIKLRIRKDDTLLLEKINSVNNINQYLISLITKDIFDNKQYNFINGEINIDFDLSKKMLELVNVCEKSDLLNDYNLYKKAFRSLELQAKKELDDNLIEEADFDNLIKRYKYERSN